ncbi:2-hydroxyacid dehydrogenase [Candidatus Allofournierella merdipullorum]|uniref:2-hydroxyacid dehydrogenase n=1 Tax=Candidatus Allofournierella merdipullorum TaxID=2838595 RepID=UPI002A8B6DCD|nr:2-hydroxyacid dehydrogenase [Candidatus Fournierella merdipullorum]
MNIVLLESLGIPDSLLERCTAPLAAAGHTFAAYPRTTDPDRLIEEARDADVLMLANMPLPGQVIRACEHLKFIDVAFTGVDHVDLDAAREMGVAVSNASGYSNDSVAELTVCMALALLRNLPQVEERCRTGGTKDGLVGHELRGKTVGLVGTGAIGSRVAQLFAAFGCRVIASGDHSHKPNTDLITYLPLTEVLAQADILSLHCPLNDSTRGLIGAEAIARMKPGALLLNAARGPVVDSAALAAALNEGRLGGAGVDVFETEPPLPADHPLLHTLNTIVTPHVAFATAESMEKRAEIVFHSLDCWLEGHQINKVL